MKGKLHSFSASGYKAPNEIVKNSVSKEILAFTDGGKSRGAWSEENEERHGGKKVVGGKPGGSLLEENQEERGWWKTMRNMVGGKPGGIWSDEN
jgi:hypothetical protein